MKNQKKKARSKEIKKISICTILFAIILSLLALLVFLNSKYDIASYTIKTDTQVYSSITESENDTEEIIYGLTDKNQKGAITAEDVKNDPAKYYGKVVKTGGEQGNLTKDYEWQIFYSDGTNIYLISTDYIDPIDAPEKDGNSVEHISTDFSRECHFTSDLYNCYDGYLGESAYTHLKDYKWNFLFCGRYGDTKCSNINAKCVSYMLDTEIWENKFSCQFKNGTVKYIIGGPTLEKFCVAYNDYHNARGCECGGKENLQCSVENNSSLGYNVDINGGKSDSWVGTGCEICADCNFLFERDTDNALGMWLASPGMSVKTPTGMFDACFNGKIYSQSMDDDKNRFPPACLPK